MLKAGGGGGHNKFLGSFHVGHLRFSHSEGVGGGGGAGNPLKGVAGKKGFTLGLGPVIFPFCSPL